ncbi:MAG: redoxin domain-containing protein [Candidatus Sulfotelmatobacter sp.]
MTRVRSSIALTSVFAAMLLACLSQPRLVQAQTGFDLEGQSVDPLAAAGGKTVVLVFLRRDCPVSSRYAPVIQKIGSERKDEVRFWLVFPDKAETSKTIQKYLHDYGYRLPALHDPEHLLVKLAQAETTPEVAVFDHSRHLLYHGRIDNWYVEFGRPRPAPTTHELNDAIEAALFGKPVTPNVVKGVGCYISDLE